MASKHKFRDPGYDDAKNSTTEPLVTTLNTSSLTKPLV